MSEQKQEPRSPAQYVNLILAGSAILLSAVYSWGISGIEVAAFGDPVGAKAFPELVTIGLLISAVMLFIEHVRDARSNVKQPEWSPISWVVIGASAWTGLYMLAFETAGFVLATTVYLTLLISYFERRRFFLTFAVALTFSVVSYFLLSVMLEANLPKGIVYPLSNW